MDLRKLSSKDASFMLEWMHDKNVVEHMHADFTNKTLTDCHKFIKASQSEFPDYHLAIVDDNDEYLGTVSLKHIDQLAKNAEFGICMRSCALGKGIAKQAMAEIVKKGMLNFGLNKIYWCVDKENKRANRFYEKCGYRQVDVVPQSIADRYSEVMDKLVWWKVDRK